MGQHYSKIGSTSRVCLVTPEMIYCLYVCLSVQVCNSIPSCFGGDYDVWTSRCFIHGNATICKSTSPHDKINHFKKVPCGKPEYTSAVLSWNTLLCKFKYVIDFFIITPCGMRRISLSAYIKYKGESLSVQYGQYGTRLINEVWALYIQRVLYASLSHSNGHPQHIWGVWYYNFPIYHR